MTRPTLTVVEGGGKPEPDPEAVTRGDMATEAIRRAIEAGNWFYVVVEAEDGFGVTFWGDALELATTVEEVARDHKRGALGFGYGDDE